jgi:hypothetical protein
MIKRSSCTICNNEDFEVIISCPNFPIMAISNDQVSDEFYDLSIIVCKECKCAQIENLVDTRYLYSDIYMNSTFSPSWTEHHDIFSKFILDNTEDTSFLEIGANKGDLYKNMLKEKHVNFTVLDMFKHEDLPNEIKFIKGNCETFNFSGFNAIILSHVFEHLYSPHTFIKNIQSAGVLSVFISIPNFDLLLKEKSIIMLHSQHTFYCGLDYIIYVFSLYNYRCKKYFLYNGNFKSIMINFILDYSSKPLLVPSTHLQLIKELYVDKVSYLNNIEIPMNTYIAPSGIYGQYIYYFLNNKDNILGFLDNNTKRHGKPLYGTNKLVYSPFNINYDTSTVLLCNCPYKDEIILTLKNICNTVKFFIIN